MGQDLLLELLELRAGVETELIGELLPHPPVGLQRLRLASGPVQRGDQQFPEAFLEGIGRDARFQFPDHVAEIAQTEPGRPLRLEQRHPRFLESCSMRFDPVSARRLEGIAPIPLEGGDTEVGRAAIVTLGEQARSGANFAQHGEGIDIGRSHVEGVAAVAALDQRWVADRPPEFGDLGLQGVAPGVDRLGSPEVVEQPFRAYEQPGVHRQAHQQLRGLAARDRDGFAVAPNFEGTEQPDLQHEGEPRRPFYASFEPCPSAAESEAIQATMKLSG